MRISDWSSDVCSSDLDDGESPAAPYAHRLDSLAQVPLAQFVGECPSNASAGYPDRMTKRDSRPIHVEPLVPAIIRTPSPSLDYRSAEHTSELQSLMRTSSALLCLPHKHNLPLSTNHPSQSCPTLT